MDDRIHQYLDGELSWEALDVDERVAARRFERAVDELREDGRASATRDVSRGVMERVMALEAETEAAIDSTPIAPSTGADSIFRRFARWLFGKREISLTLRPGYAVAVLALLAGAGLWWNGDAPTGPVATSTTASQQSGQARVYVRFQLMAPEARSVELAGSFSGWSPNIDLRRMPDGRWAALVPLPPGVHDYAFRVDDERWMPDPSAPRVADGFGGYNSRLSLVLAES